MMNEPWQRLPALSLKQLQYFVTLAQLRHFTDTASRLAISQPALSSALRQIETVLGGKLVNRTAATVTLTELGAAILPHAQRILSVAQAAFSDMQQIVEAGGDGTVRIGLVPSVSSLLFPLLPQTMAEAFPRLRIEFHDQTNDALIQALQRGEIDFGIGAIDSSLPAELLVYPLREDPFVAVLHRDDPLAEMELGLEDFAWVTDALCDVAERHCGGKVVSTLEGGYDLQALAASVAVHVQVLMERSG